MTNKEWTYNDCLKQMSRFGLCMIMTSPENVPESSMSESGRALSRPGAVASKSDRARSSRAQSDQSVQVESVSKLHI